MMWLLVLIPAITLVAEAWYLVHLLRARPRSPIVQKMEDMIGVVNEDMAITAAAADLIGEIERFLAGTPVVRPEVPVVAGDLPPEARKLIRAWTGGAADIESMLIHLYGIDQRTARLWLRIGERGY